jgi:hypothetical protein
MLLPDRGNPDYCPGGNLCMNTDCKQRGAGHGPRKDEERIAVVSSIAVVSKGGPERADFRTRQLRGVIVHVSWPHIN